MKGEPMSSWESARGETDGSLWRYRYLVWAACMSAGVWAAVLVVVAQRLS